MGSRKRIHAGDIMVTVRDERPADVDAVRTIHEAAFPSPLEAQLVDILRNAGKGVVSLVAERDGRVVGHIMFSPVQVEHGAKHGLGLAPVAVTPLLQSQGIGSMLVQSGLAAARQRGYDFVVLLGDPAYYRRFGFTKASGYGLTNQWGVDDPFMALALTDNGLDGVSGRLPTQLSSACWKPSHAL